MNWKLIGRTFTNIFFSWEGIGIGVAWGAYLLASMLIQDPILKDSVPDWLASAAVSLLFWLAVVKSGIIVVIAYLKLRCLPQLDE